MSLSVFIVSLCESSSGSSSQGHLNGLLLSHTYPLTQPHTSHGAINHINTHTRTSITASESEWQIIPPTIAPIHQYGHMFLKGEKRWNYAAKHIQNKHEEEKFLGNLCSSPKRSRAFISTGSWTPSVLDAYILCCIHSRNTNLYRDLQSGKLLHTILICFLLLYYIPFKASWRKKLLFCSFKLSSHKEK